MAENLLNRFGELIATGTQLAPLGGFDFSGYNARLQNKYLEWRKGCLEVFEQVGPIGFSYKTKVLNDQNGSFFYQNSALLLLNGIKDLYEKVKATPELAAAPVPVSAPAAETPAPPSPPPDSSGPRILKPPPKKVAPAATMPAQQAQESKPALAASGPTKVYVVGEPDDPLRVQVSDFLGEVGLGEIPLDRQHGQMINLENLEEHPEAKFAIFVINSEDLSYAMFEIGHFVGKLGKGRVTILHMTDVSMPKSVPGVNVRPIVVKLEEASLSLMKELKAIGYQISL